MQGFAAGCGSILYFGRVWPGATLFIFVCVGRLLLWPGAGHVWTYLYWLAMTLPCLLLALQGDNLIDIGGKALVDVRSGWPDLWAGQLDRFADFDYVPVKIVLPEGFEPILTLPGGMRTFLPTLGDVHAFWVRVPASPDPSKPLPKMRREPRAYPLASYRTYVFLPFAPDRATLEERFKLFHEIGHALFSRSFPAIGQVQTWPCLVLLMLLTLAVTGMSWAQVWPIGATLILWQSVTLVRTAPSFERERFSELWADFYAIAHMRGTPEVRPYIEKMIEGLRARREPSAVERADDLETLLTTIGPRATDDKEPIPDLGVDQLGNVHARLVRHGSEHPPLLVLIVTLCLGVVGYRLAIVRPEPMLAFAAIYLLIPFLACYFGPSRQNARQGARVDHFLRERQPAGETQDPVALAFS